MNIEFHIDCDGQLEILEENSGTKAPKDARQVITGRRQQNQMELHLQDDAGWVALLRLIDFLRAIKDVPTTIYFHDSTSQNDQHIKPPKSYDDKADLFLYLGRLCLFSFEKTEENEFGSHLSIFPSIVNVSDSLPFLFLNLGQIAHRNEPTKQALQKIDPDIWKYCSLFTLDPNHSCKPEDIAEICAYPEQLHTLEYAELMQTAYGKWIDLVGRISLSVRQPLLQFGSIKDKSSKYDEMVFYRAIIPFASIYERPQNFRIMILSYFPQQEIWGL